MIWKGSHLSRTAAASLRPSMLAGTSFNQMKIPALLTLDRPHGAIGNATIRSTVQGDPDRKTTFVLPDDLNATDRLAPRLVPDCVQALLSQGTIS